MSLTKGIRNPLGFIRLTQLTAALLLVVGEVIWVGLWYQTFLMNVDLDRTKTGVVFCGLMFLAYLLAQPLYATRLVKSISQVILYAGLVLGFLLATKILLDSQGITFFTGLRELNHFVVVTILVEVWLLWRGVSLSQDAIQPKLAWRRFLTGLLMILANMLIITRVEPGVAGWGSFLGYLFVGMTAIILARVSYAGMIHGLKSNPFDRYWIVITLGLIGGLLLVFTVIAALLTGQFASLLQGVATVIKVISRVAIILLLLPEIILTYLFLYLIDPLGPILEKLFDFRVFAERGLNLELPPIERDSGLEIWFGMWPDILRGVLFWVVITILIAAIIFYLRQRRSSRRRIRVESESENLLQEGEARKLLIKALQDAMQGIAHRLRPAPQKIALANIRRIYAQLLALGAELELPRSAYQTPTEYLPVLKIPFVNLEPEVEQITQSYQDVRYGEIPETPEGVQQAETAWEKLEAEGKRLKIIQQAQHKPEIPKNLPEESHREV